MTFVSGSHGSCGFLVFAIGMATDPMHPHGDLPGRHVLFSEMLCLVYVIQFVVVHNPSGAIFGADRWEGFQAGGLRPGSKNKDDQKQVGLSEHVLALS